MPAEEKKALKSHGSVLVRVAKHARQVGEWWPVWTLRETSGRAPPRANTTQAAQRE